MSLGPTGDYRTQAGNAVEVMMREYARKRLGGPGGRPELVDKLAAALELIVRSNPRRRYALEDPTDANLDRVVHADVAPDSFRETCGSFLTQGGVPSNKQERLILEYAVALHPRKLLPTGADGDEQRQKKLDVYRDRLNAFLVHRGSSTPQMTAYIAGTIGGGRPATGLVAAVPITYLWAADDCILTVMQRNFAEDGEFVEYLCKNWMSAPAPGDPDPYGNQALYDRARKVRALISRKAQQCGVNDLSRRRDAVDNAWTWVWKRLTDGIHGYRYEARFTHWLKHEIQAFDFGPFRGLPGEPPEGPPGETSLPPLLTREQIRVTREAYRLVRCTFFGEAAGDSKAAVVRANEEVRAAVDDLYKRWLALGQPGEERQAVGEVAARHGVEYHTVNNWFNELRGRIRTYMHARYSDEGPLSNEEILRRAKCRSRGAEVAAMAKASPGGKSSVWVFSAYVNLRPDVDARRRDPWSYERLMREIGTHWLADDYVREAIAEEIAGPGPLATCLRRALREIVGELCPAGDGDGQPPSETPSGCEEMLRIVADSLAEGRVVTRCEPIIRQCLAEILGTTALWKVSSKSCKKACHGIERGERCWVIPAWYLVLVERLNEEEIARRLALTDEEKQVVARLVDRFQHG